MGAPPPQLAPVRPPATMSMLMERVSPAELETLGPRGEVLPEKVDFFTVVVPKFTTAPPPLVPAVLLVKVLLEMLRVASLSRAPPPGPVLPTKVYPGAVG